MNDFTLVALIANATMAAGAIWWWARFGRYQDRWRVPAGGIAVALVIVLVALLAEYLSGMSQ
jgi:hypothetical protein